jgi:hypothetical protein
LTVEFISETLTDESYFTVAPPIMHRLLTMQSGPPLLRSKALSVFRACIEQMEMYKDTSAYKDAVRSYVDSSLQPWIEALNRNLAVDITTAVGDEYDAVVKLTYATYKVSFRPTFIERVWCCEW